MSPRRKPAPNWYTAAFSLLNGFACQQIVFAAFSLEAAEKEESKAGSKIRRTV
jgi:hypothetical protein